MSKARALGKGLGALIPQIEEEDLQNTQEIPIVEIVITRISPGETSIPRACKN